MELALQAQLQVQAVYAGNSAELMGINTARELIEAEEFLRNTLVQRFIEAGVRIRNHSQVRISPQTRIAPGVDICGPCEIYGSSNIEAGTVIASHCVLNNVHLGACQIRPFSHIDETEYIKSEHGAIYAREGSTLVINGGIIESHTKVVSLDCSAQSFMPHSRISSSDCMTV